MKLRSIFWWVRERFSFPHAFAGMLVYGLVIAVVNYDKPWLHIAELVMRQAVVSFPITGIFVRRVQRDSQHPVLVMALFWGVLFPAASMTAASTVAHFYFTSEVRNIVGPFLVSASLNALLTRACRLGYHTLPEQIAWGLRGFR